MFFICFQCDDEEDTQEKRGYVSPDELIYAQPVDIKPIGKPIASIPIRGPPRAYGSPRPVPYPQRPQKGPPKRIGYGGSSRPGFSEKYGQVSSGVYSQSQNNGLYGGYGDYQSKPPSFGGSSGNYGSGSNGNYGGGSNGGSSPYVFEKNKPTYNKVPQNTQIKPDTTVQQHVHHHYVHDDGNKDPKVIIKPVAIPVGSVGSIPHHYNQQPDVITGQGEDFSEVYSGGFKPMSGIFSDNKPFANSDTIYGSQYNKGSQGFSSQTLPNYGSNAFNDHDFKKKEYVEGSNALYNQGPATFGGQSNSFQENNYHDAKAQGFECVCVNYDQCPSQEIIGRRDDLYLPIDPRNKGSEIAALTEEQIDNITSIVEPVKTSDNATADNSTEVKSITKREVKEEDEEEVTKEAQPVSR